MTVIDLAVEQPRVLHLPKFGPSAGEDAIGQAAAAGLHLDPWQQYVLRQSLGERPDGRWAAFEVGLVVARQQGKGSVLEARELAGLLHFGEKLVMHTAHELKTSMEHFRRLMALFDASDDLRKRVKRVTRGNGKEGLEMVNGARLHCIARSKGSGRGFSGDLVVLDEAYALTAAQMEATMPTMLARDNAQVWYTSSPPLDPVSGEVLMKVKRRAETGGEERLAWFDYGLPGCLDNLRDVDLDDRTNWYAALPSLRSGRVREENVVAMRRILPTDQGFAREILGIWPPDLSAGFAVISAQAWQDARDPASQLDGTPAFAVDVAPDRSRASIGVAGRREDGLTHVEVVESRPGTGWVVPRLVQLRDRWKPCAIVFDPGSPGGSLIADAEAAGLELVRTGTRDVAQAYGMFVDGVCDADEAARVVRHLGQAELDAAVSGAARRSIGDGHAWDRRGTTTDLTPLVAATNAMWGYAVHGHTTTATPWVMFA
jgi:hypothetical protein